MANWKEEIPLSEVLRDEDLALDRARELVIERIKASQWYQNAEEYGDLWDLVDELGNADTVGLLDHLLDQLYSLANEDLVWLGL
jgi:hypothetical protein